LKVCDPSYEYSQQSERIQDENVRAVNLPQFLPGSSTMPPFRENPKSKRARFLTLTPNDGTCGCKNAGQNFLPTSQNSPSKYDPPHNPNHARSPARHHQFPSPFLR